MTPATVTERRTEQTPDKTAIRPFASRLQTRNSKKCAGASTRTEIDGLDIHFLHVRSKHDDAMPLIDTHGWPGSPIEQLKIIDPLANPRLTAPARRTPSTWRSPRWPVTDFQARPRRRLGPARMTRAWVELMKRYDPPTTTPHPLG
jgi:hypothetical protein